MRWFWFLIPLGISYYTITFGVWVWRNGNRRGGVGVCVLSTFIIAVAIFMLYFNKRY